MKTAMELFNRPSFGGLIINSKNEVIRDESLHTIPFSFVTKTNMSVIDSQTSSYMYTQTLTYRYFL